MYIYNVHMQVDLEGTGIVAYENAATLVPDLLLQIFAMRVQQSMVHVYVYLNTAIDIIIIHLSTPSLTI